VAVVYQVLCKHPADCISSIARGSTEHGTYKAGSEDSFCPPLRMVEIKAKVDNEPKKKGSVGDWPKSPLECYVGAAVLSGGCLQLSTPR
jgi:hypothetical protein